MKIRKATAADIPAIAQIFSDIHTAEENGLVTIGWQRDIYPTADTARTALERGDIFVQEDGGVIVGTGIINQLQVDVYRGAKWKYEADDALVMVLHTLVISPKAARRGYGQKFVEFYEDYARTHGCKYLRIDTNEKNKSARALYKKLGYDEVDTVPCVFNGLEGVHLVLLEKKTGGFVPPESEDLNKLIGTRRLALWYELCGRIDNLYDMERQWNSGGKKWDYEYKYRRGGKTLCALYARDDCAGFVVIMGGAEREKFEARRGEFSQKVCSYYDEAATYHDGKWIMFPIEDSAMFDDYMRILEIKRKPNRK